MHLYTHIRRIYTHTHTHTHTHTRIYIYLHCIYICIYICIDLYIHLYVYFYLHIYTYLYICYIVTYADSHLHTCTYICRIIHNDTTIKTDAWRKTQEDFFTKIYTSLSLLQGFERVVQGLHVRGSWRPNINCNILTPLLWPSRCVFLVLLMLGSTPSGFPRVWPPYHIWSLAV